MWKACQKYQQPLKRLSLSSGFKHVVSKQTKSAIVSQCAIHSSAKTNNSKDGKYSLLIICHNPIS